MKSLASSAGYRVDDWEITDADGKVLDPDKERINFDDDLTFTATRWHLYEASLVSWLPIRQATSDRSAHASIRPRMSALECKLGSACTTGKRQLEHGHA